MIKGKIFNIQKFSIHDGPGIRTLVFFQGCPLRCAWCSNPESIPLKGGNEYSIEELLDELDKDLIFYEESGGGITLGGGEPTLQAEFAKSLLEKIKLREKPYHTAIETCGYSSWQGLSSLLPYLDLIYYDLKMMDLEKHLFWTGQSNLLVKENLLKICHEFKGEIIIRIPVIPQVNEDEDNFNRLGEFLSANLEKRKKELKVELLPYHLYGKHKYEQLKQTYKGPSHLFSSDEWTGLLQTKKEILKKYGIKTINSDKTSSSN